MKKGSLLKNKTLIIGCGRLGASIASKDSASGKNVIVIDRDPNSFELLSDRFSGLKFTGDATDLSLLEEAFITSTKDIVVATGDDNINVFLAQIARQIYNVPNIYVRLDDPSLEILLRGLDVHAIYPFELSLDKFLLVRGGKRK
ncbi:MAG: NAD-binding protein [Bacilli bacterium]|nr:NAD-binding protein [Bacilli bacterium]